MQVIVKIIVVQHLKAVIQSIFGSSDLWVGLAWDVFMCVLVSFNHKMDGKEEERLFFAIENRTKNQCFKN